MAVVHERSSRERTLALLFIATGALFGLYGTGLGALMLAVLSGYRIPISLTSFEIHPYAQIYGFLFQFVVGVEYLLVPRFKAEKILSIKSAYLCYALLVISDAIFVASDYLSYQLLGSLASALFLFGIFIFSYHTLQLAFKKKGGFPETDPLIAESSIAAFLSSILLFISENSWLGIYVDIFSDPSLYLALLGFVASMIYAVEIRSVSFRQSDYRPLWAKATWISQAIAIILCFASIFYSVMLFFISQIFFLFASIFAAVSMKLFDLNHPLMYRPSMTQIHYRIMNYNNLTMIPSFIWLYIASIAAIIISLGSINQHILGFGPILASISDSLYTRDLFIHCLAIGFIGSTILCYAPMLLPGLLGRRGPTTGLSYYPALILNAAVLIRAAGDIDALTTGRLPEWEAISGLLVLISMLWFLYMIHRLGKGKIRPEKEMPFLSEKRLEGVAEIKILNDKISNSSPAYWFVFKKGTFYVLPQQHRSFDLLSLINDSKNVIIELEGKRLIASYQLSEDKKLRRLAEKLFKDKYSHRNFRDFFGEKAEKVLVLKLLESYA